MAINYELLPVHEDDQLPAYTSTENVEANPMDNINGLDSKTPLLHGTDIEAPLKYNLNPRTAIVVLPPNRKIAQLFRIAKCLLYINHILLVFMAIHICALFCFPDSGIAVLSFSNGGGGKQTETTVTSKLAVAQQLTVWHMDIQDRHAAHQSFILTAVSEITTSLTAITSTLDAASSDAAHIRSLISMSSTRGDRDGDKCDIRCATAVTAFLQTRDLDMGSEGLTKVFRLLEGVGVEMAEYSAFLTYAEEGIKKTADALALKFKHEQEHEQEKEVLASTSKVQQPGLDGPKAVLYQGEFNTTEACFENGGDDLKSAVIEAYSTSTALPPSHLDLSLQDTITASPGKGSLDERVYLCFYSVRVSSQVPPARKVDLLSLECGVAV